MEGQSTALSPHLMSEKDFSQFSNFIYSELGIKISTKKKVMLQARLQKRLRNLGLGSFREYCDYVFSLKGLDIEVPHLVDAVTTNTTDFFREPKHFDFLTNQILPRRRSRGRPYATWSAGCSSGQEPYTLAMVLSEFTLAHSDFHFTILATDVSNEILQTAVRAVYSMDKVARIPATLKHRYLLKSKNHKKKLVRIAPEIRSKVHFRPLNFMSDFSFREEMDLIFCRNVMIYFDRPTQERLLKKFCEHLNKGGHLFIGHSESLTGLKLPLKQLIPTVYEKI